MLMTDNFAVTIAVVIPVVLLAAGVEARDFERTSRELRTTGRFRFVANVAAGLWAKAGIEPGMGREETERRLRPVFEEALRGRGFLRLALLGNLTGRIAAAVGVVWAATVVSLTVAQIWVLVWLTSPRPQGDSALAVFSVAAVAAGITMQFGAPVVRLLANTPDRRDVERVMREALSNVLGESDTPLDADAVLASPGRERVREARVRASGRVVPRRDGLPEQRRAAS